MIRRYKLNKIAGPSGTFAGYILLIFGAVSSVFVLSGIPILILGLYLSFGTYCSTIDADQRKVRSGIMLFGWAISGKWINIDDTYKTEIRKIKGRHTVYSSGNRSLNIEEVYFKIYVYSVQDSTRAAITIVKDEVEAREKVTVIRDLLQLKKPES